MIRKGEEFRPKLVAVSRQAAKNVSNLRRQRCKSTFQDAEVNRILERVCRDELEAVFAPECNAIRWLVLGPLGVRPLLPSAPLTTHGAHHGSILDTLHFLPLATEAGTGFLVEAMAGPPAPPCQMVRLSPLAVESPSFDAWAGLPATAAPSSHLSRQLVPKRYLQVLDTLRFLPLFAEAETGFLVEAVAGPPAPPCQMIRLSPLAVKNPSFDAWPGLPATAAPSSHLSCQLVPKCDL